jgi:hypothetical protein
MNKALQRKVFLILTMLFIVLHQPTSRASVDLQADLNKIVAGINKFDANSAQSTSLSSIAGVKQVFANNAAILLEIQSAVTVFKKDLNSVKSYIPKSDTKDTPRFSTLMNLALGYEEWLKYQKKNQALAEKCLRTSGKTYNSFTNCSLKELPTTLENERLGRAKLQTAWNAWKQWQIKFGHA